jgi:hypothetical protein
MTIVAIRVDDTVHVLDPSQVRWFEYHDRHKDLTIFYHHGGMETIRGSNMKKIFNDLLMYFNVLDNDSEDYKVLRRH